ncbi:MAG: carbon starvation CstA family protein [Halanaerobiales bacterium]
MTILVIYTFAAITMPVWALLAPRDYLNTMMVNGGLGVSDIFIYRPEIQLPMNTSFFTDREPLRPMIMANITCGAASGIH